MAIGVLLHVRGTIGLPAMIAFNAAALGSTFAAGWLFGRRRSRESSPTLVREFLVDYHQIRHETFDRHRPFARLRLWAQGTAAGLDGSESDLASACGEFLAMGLPALRRFAGRAEALAVSAACVRTIRDELDRVERRLRETLAVGGAGSRLRIEDALRHVEVLSDACRRAYDEVAMRAPCRPDQVIEEVVRAKSGTPVLQSVRVSYETDPDARVPVLFETTALRALIGELVENAGRALKQTAAPELSLRVAAHTSDPRFVIVTVEDNGSGLHVPAVSEGHPETGGFGFAHARDTARAWLGELELGDRVPGGSVATLRLRVLTPDNTSEGVRV